MIRGSPALPKKRKRPVIYTPQGVCGPPLLTRFHVCNTSRSIHGASYVQATVEGHTEQALPHTVVWGVFTCVVDTTRIVNFRLFWGK